MESMVPRITTIKRYNVLHYINDMIDQAMKLIGIVRK